MKTAIYKFFYCKKTAGLVYEPTQLLCEWFNDELTERDVTMLKIGMAYACRIKYKTGKIRVFKNGKLVDSCLIG